MPELPVFVGVFLLCFIAACGVLSAVAIALVVRWAIDELPFWAMKLRVLRERRARRRH